MIRSAGDPPYRGLPLHFSMNCVFVTTLPAALCRMFYAACLILPGRVRRDAGRDDTGTETGPVIQLRKGYGVAAFHWLLTETVIISVRSVSWHRAAPEIVL